MPKKNTQPSIEQVRNQAMAVLEARADRHLPLGMRQAVWNALGPRATASTRGSPPHRRRIALALAAAERVRPIWKRQYPRSRLWPKVVTSIGQVVRAELDSADAVKRFDECWAEIMQMATRAPSPAIAAGFAVTQALGTAIVDEQFNPEAIDPRREDGDDPEDFDPAVYAEAAEAGGLPSDENASVARRQKFWVWWLAEAATPTLSEAALLKL